MVPYTGVYSNQAEKIDLKSVQCGFESHHAYKINNIKENVMSYTITTKHVWYNEGKIIVKMYFFEGMPFTFDEMPDGHLYDRDLVEEANKNQSYEVDDVYRGSNYMIMEEMHPCFNNVDISNPKDLPIDLIPFYDEEDLLG